MPLPPIVLYSIRAIRLYMKYNSIGIFIKSQLYYPSKISYKRYPLKSGYELWQVYNEQQNSLSRKGVRYYSFLKYIYVLKRLQLIVEIEKTRKSRVPKPGEKHPNDFIPEEWQKNFYRIMKDNVDSMKWNNPYNEYKRLTGKIYYEKGVAIERYPVLTEAETLKKKQEALFKKLAIPAKYVTVKISSELKTYIDNHKGNKTISGYLTEKVLGTA